VQDHGSETLRYALRLRIGETALPRDLYRFLRTMDMYRATIDKNSWLVLSTNADVFRYLQSAGGAGPARPTKR
jgi:hypothetical protein